MITTRPDSLLVNLTSVKACVCSPVTLNGHKHVFVAAESRRERERDKSHSSLNLTADKAKQGLNPPVHVAKLQKSW